MSFPLPKLWRAAAVRPPAPGTLRARTPAATVGVALLCLLATASAAQLTNASSLAAPWPDASFSVLRVFGALALVVALFLGGVWCFRHWQRLAVTRGRSPKLKILEVKPLGHRHALYVVAYEHQRLLVASSPAGVQLVSPLPDADEDEPASAAPSFAETLQHAFAPKS